MQYVSDLVVVHDTVHALDPVGIQVAIEHDPLCVLVRSSGKVAHDGRQQALHTNSNRRTQRRSARTVQAAQTKSERRCSIIATCTAHGRSRGRRTSFHSRVDSVTLPYSSSGVTAFGFRSRMTVVWCRSSFAAASVLQHSDLPAPAGPMMNTQCRMASTCRSHSGTVTQS
jgi:hypothetical protein